MSPAAARTPSRSRRQPAAAGAAAWSRRWIRALESLGATYPNTRLPRGRTLARGGAVQGLAVRPGEVTARVEQPKGAWEVKLVLPVFSDDQWAAGVRALAGQLQHAASLLEGRMPENLDETLGRAELTAFPRRGELSSHCDCRDNGDPCVHGAAVHYTFAEALQDNPFLLLALRGRSREELLAELRAARSGGVPGGTAGPPGVPVAELPAGEAFFAGGDFFAVPLHPQQPADPAGRLRRRCPPPGCTPAQAEALATVVENAAGYAYRLAQGT
ncbi:SWIM zinc finger family protein [Streptomyces fuscichromogenes]|uniref:SWIM-type domain-containing protein n=1 Tax=Streptomyces fuscichromogenes TaxID=1324013 RepID=A0A918CVK9_9ACTN|nr:SWIM zinc finger family protein [Streptomyces fuscichromogenes]GGN33643.1 hypothetical protein GCM10011578_073630 [Streptomyces fuscichromogenes]